MNTFAIVRAVALTAAMGLPVCAQSVVPGQTATGVTETAGRGGGAATFTPPQTPPTPPGVPVPYPNTGLVCGKGKAAQGCVKRR